MYKYLYFLITIGSTYNIFNTIKYSFQNVNNELFLINNYYVIFINNKTIFLINISIEFNSLIF